MAEFWVRNTTAGAYTLNDMGMTIPASGEIDLHLHFFFDVIQASEDLNAALSSGDLVRLDSEGGSIIPFVNAYDDAVVAHNIAGDSHYGALSTDEVTEGTSNLYYTEGRVSANTNVSANTTHRGQTDNPHSVTKTQVGLGNVTNDAQVKKSATSTDNALIRWDGTTGDAVQDTGIIVDDNDKVVFPGSGAVTDLFTIDPNTNQWSSRGAPESGYVATIRAPADQSGLFIKASDDVGTYPIHIEDDDGTTQLLHMEHAGEIGLGSVTPTYGVDNQRAAGDTADYNTENGLYRIGSERANDAITAYDSLGNQSFTALTQINLDATTVIGNLYSLATDAVTVNATGRYLISYQVSLNINVGSTRTSTESSLFRDVGSGFVEVVGSRSYGYHRTSANGEDTATATLVLDLNSGDRLAVGSEVLAGGAVTTIALGSRLTVQRLS